MAFSSSSGEWDLDRIRQLVTQHELERGRIEYKSELGNGRKTLEAITALANTFGGVVLVGVDEDREGVDRLVGVPGADRDRLSRMCWDQLTPPFNPEIQPVRLDREDRYVLVVVVDSEFARRPVMLNNGNKVLVRIEGHNATPDWYRLRDLFTEDSGPASVGGLTPGSISIHPPGDLIGHESERPLDFGIRGQLWLAGPHGKSAKLTEAARQAALDALNHATAPLTGSHSELHRLLDRCVRKSWYSPDDWYLFARNTSKHVHARWQALAEFDGGQRLAEVRLGIDLALASPRRDSLTIQIDTLFATSYLAERLRVFSGDSSSNAAGAFLYLGPLGRLILATISTLWGSLGGALSTGVFGQPLGPQAELAMSLGTLGASQERPNRIDHVVHFGTARLIPRNEPGIGQEFQKIWPDHHFDPVAQQAMVREWLIELGVNHGYQDVEQEVDRQDLS